jgi:uncharacterized protein YcbX
VHITRVGLAALKGTRHRDRASVALTLDGPVGDRVFCLVDRARGRVLRTVENPELMRTRVDWAGGVLSVVLPDEAVSGEPVPTGETLKVDYWGRVAGLEVVDGPWAAAYTRFLGYDVVLARAGAPGEVVYGASVSIVTTASLRDLAGRAGAEVLDRQFRATLTVATDEPFAEDAWPGRRLRVGAAEVQVRGPVPRCAVVDLDPETGRRRTHALRTLADYRRHDGEIVFGIDAVVTRAGVVHTGDPVGLAPGRS